MKSPEEIKNGLRHCRKMSICSNKCKYYMETECNVKLLDDAKAYIEQLEATQMKWISIQKQQPKDGQKVIMINAAHPHITIQGIYKADETPDAIRICGIIVGTVTHWMPTPEPPKEG